MIGLVGRWAWSLGGIGIIVSFIGSVFIFMEYVKSAVAQSMFKWEFGLHSLGLLFQVISWGLNTPHQSLINVQLRPQHILFIKL
jgi:hypothetical protein